MNAMPHGTSDASLRPAAESEGNAQRLRVRPAVVMVLIFWSAFLALGALDVPMYVRFLIRAGVIGVFVLVFAGWWLTRRAVPRGDRFLVIGVALAAAVAFTLPADPSVLAAAFLFLAVPYLLTVWTAWLVWTRPRSDRLRRNGMITFAAIAVAPVCLVRMDGLRGTGEADFHWRWSPTAEETFLGLAGSGSDRPSASAGERSAETPTSAVWPGFRGPDRDGVVRGASIATNWTESPPARLWQRRIGPGWSSMAIVGDRLFTQDQRGDLETVICLDAGTGDDVWVHTDACRFDEAMGGPGPRATPTVEDGRVYALGAMGVLNCLDAATGARRWSADIRVASGAEPPMWGYSASPLVADGRVIVFAGGGGGSGLLAYDADNGTLAWTAPAGNHGYSSPHLARLGGVPQVIMLSNDRLAAFDPATGAVLWSHPAPPEAQGQPVVQPLMLDESRIVISYAPDAGTSLLRAAFSETDTKWRVETAWQSRGMKPFFNDFVARDGYLYGFDGAIFCCLDLATGERRWKGGRYGTGQVLLLAEQGLLLVLSEQGEVVLLAASPDEHSEMGRFQAISGKTWNHPVVAGGRLYVRNAEQIACYLLSPAG